MIFPAPWTNLVLSLFWIFAGLAGTGMTFSAQFRAYLKTYPQEGIFCGLYLVAIFCYDYRIWARGSFIRFSIPLLPFVCYAPHRMVAKKPADRVVFGRGCADTGRLFGGRGSKWFERMTGAVGFPNRRARKDGYSGLFWRR